MALIVGCMTLIGFVYFQVNMSQAAKDIQKSETQMSSNKQSASQRSSKKGERDPKETTVGTNSTIENNCD